MKGLKKFFDELQLPKEVVPNGSTIWENPQSDSPMNHIIHRKYYPLNDIQINNLELEVNKMIHTQVIFPKWYKDFLRYTNGIDVFFGAISLYGYQIINREPKNESPYSLYTENLGRHKKVPKEWLFVGAYGYDGTEIVIDTKSQGSRVFCIYNETDKIICEWDSFEEFLSSELARLFKLWDQYKWSRNKRGPVTLPIGHKDSLR